MNIHLRDPLPRVSETEGSRAFARPCESSGHQRRSSSLPAVDVAFRRMAELVALTEWRITTHWPNPAMTSSVVLPWCRLPRPKYWRARTNSGRCYQVARQVAKLKSLAGLGWTDAEAKALRAAARVVVGEIDGFLAARDAARPARYRTDLSDLEIVAARLDGVDLDRKRDTIHGRLTRAMAAIEKRFGKYYRPIGIETRQFEKKPCQTGVIGIEQPAWIRELHARFGESRSGESISKSELRYQA